MASRMDTNANEEGTDNHFYGHHASRFDTLVLDCSRVHSARLNRLKLTILLLAMSVTALGAVTFSISVGVLM